MKHLLYISVVLLALSSCATKYRSLVVTGKPGTVILTGENVIGTISNSGSAEIQLKADTYHSYLLAKSPDSDKYIPFALEFEKKTKKHFLLKTAQYAGAGVAFAGASTELIGAIMGVAAAKEEDEDLEKTATTFMLAGLGGVLAGIGIGWPAAMAIENNHDVQFGYVYNPIQSTNNDIYIKPRAKKAAPVVVEQEKEEVKEDINEVEYVEYEIKSGDTLSGIAKKFNVSQNSILKANNMSSNSTIYPGKKIKIALNL